MAPLSIIVCGTNYGQAYLSALMESDEAFELVGIYARGSQRSQGFAAELGVPLYTSPNQLPDSVDVACVAVGDDPSQRAGSRLVSSLLDRRIHIIQEHPVYPVDVSRAIKKASRLGVRYHINTHFGDMPAVTAFVDHVRARLAEHPPLYIHAVASAQCSYSLIDILHRALGALEPYGFTHPARWDDDLTAKNRCEVNPFRCVQGVLAGVPTTLMLQSYYDPSDAGNHQLIMHRITIGTREGNTTLVNTFGPVVWSASLNAAGFALADATTRSSMSSRVDALRAQTQPLTQELHSGPPTTMGELTTQHWQTAIRSTLTRLARELDTDTIHPAQSDAHLRSVSKAWFALLQRIGATEQQRID